MVPANRADPGPWAGRWASSDTWSSSSSPIAQNYAFGAYYGPNVSTLSTTKVNTLICPSENVKNGPWIASTWTNYHANFGGPSPIESWSGLILPFRSDPNSWPGYTNAVQTGELGVVGFESITDGTSNTALFSEKMVGLNGFVATALPGSQNGKRVSFQTSINSTWDDPNGLAVAQQFLAACKGMPSSTQPTNPTQWTGACWDGSHAGTLHFNAYDHFNTPNGLSCVSANSWGGPPGGFNDIITATSNHPGGVNVCMGDGSVKFIKDSISPNTWWALGTRDGGEVISSDAY